MRVIGLTGGIASGKSTVSRRLRALGARIVDADGTARALQRPGAKAAFDIAREFGEEYAPGGALDRAKLGALVFSDERARKRLEKIMLPLILKSCAEQIERARRDGCVCAVLDAPTLIESGARAMVDEVWLVCLPLEMQLERLLLRGGQSREEALLRIQSQMPLEEKARYADVTIDNSGPLEKTHEQVDALWRARFQ